MDDYWTDVARPRRRNWWQLDEDDGGQSLYPPIGLEAFRPEQAPTIGFNVKAPEPEPHEQFAQAWKKAADPGSDAPREDERDDRSLSQEQGLSDLRKRPDQATPSHSIDSYDWRQYASPWGTPAIAGRLARQIATAAAEVAATAGPAIDATGKAIASGVDSAMKEVGPRAAEIAALLNPLHAPRLLTDFSDRDARRTDLGNGYHFVERPDGTASIRQSDGGFLGTGIGETTTTLPVDARVVVRPDGTRDQEVDWDALQGRIGYDDTLRAMQKLSTAMARPPKDKEELPPLPGTTGDLPEEQARPEQSLASIAEGKPPQTNASSIAPPPNKEPGPPDPWGHLAKRIAQEFPHLVRQSLDHWSVDGIEPNPGELENERSCKSIQRLRGEPAPDSQFRGDNGLKTPFGTVAPTVGGPQATTAPEDSRHFKGILGETEMAMRIYNAVPNAHIFAYGNAPGVNGPDGIAVSDGFDNPMILESKYASGSKPVSPSQAAIMPSRPEAVLRRFEIGKESGRIPEEIIDRAADSFLAGNYSTCTAGTGEAFNGYIVHYRNGRPVIVKRIKQ